MVRTVCPCSPHNRVTSRREREAESACLCHLAACICQRNWERRWPARSMWTVVSAVLASSSREERNFTATNVVQSVLCLIETIEMSLETMAYTMTSIHVTVWSCKVAFLEQIPQKIIQVCCSCVTWSHRSLLVTMCTSLGDKWYESTWAALRCHRFFTSHLSYASVTLLWHSTNIACDRELKM